jgi:hypothetical protein
MSFLGDSNFIEQFSENRGLKAKPVLVLAA